MEGDAWILRLDHGVFSAILVAVDHVGEELEKIVTINSRDKKVLKCCAEKALVLGWDALRDCVGS